jgi:hypothetical protein
MPNFGGVHIGVRSQNNSYILFIFNLQESLGGNHEYSNCGARQG